MKQEENIKERTIVENEIEAGIETEMGNDATDGITTDGEEKIKVSAGNVYGTVLGRIGDILALHFAFLICSLPILTIGASCSAAIYVGMKMATGQEGYVLSNFFKAFKENFKRSTLYWLLAVAVGIGIWYSCGYWSAIGGSLGMVLSVVTIVMAILFVMVVLYVFGVQAKFYNTISATIKNAFLMSVRHFHITLLMVLVLVMFVYLAVYFVPMQAIAAVSGAGILSLIFGKLYNIVFSSYI